ncbi:MAG TPA: VWA domain-containing protein, partial [Thermoanaerobaculia bacterium]|nr:VWA domain-containing protein [Thermoanaerobaculia bacterium]
MNHLRNALLASLLAAVAASAQEGSQLPKLTETIDVRVINIDVVVTDRKGNPITGLTRDDFEIYENGVLKPISNFYEVNAAAPPLVATETPMPVAPPQEPIPETQKRRIILYVDNLSLAPFNRNRVFRDMKEFIKKVMRPGDEAMIATFNRSLKIRVPFTRDVVHLQQTLDSLAGEASFGISSRSERRDAEDRIRDARNYNEALAVARQYAQSVEHDLRQSVTSINGLISTLAGVEGKKILVLTSEGFPIQPGREMFVLLDEISREKQWSLGGTLLEGLGFASQDLIQSVARTANANGITMYTLHAAGLTANEGMSAENARATSMNVSHAASSNSTESMQVMADMTGGLSSVNTNNFQLAFERIRRDLDSYYSLGYRSGTERVDRQRNLAVRTKNRNYVVRSRRTFVEKSTHAEMSDRVIANLLYKTKANDLKIFVRTSTPRPTDDRDLFRIPVEVQIPMDSLTLLPQGDTYAGGFEVYVAVANKDGDMSDVAHKTHALRVPASDLPNAKGKYYTYSLDLLMEKGVNRISVAVV